MSAPPDPGPDLRAAIDQEDMSRFQVVAVATCVVLNMLDGFDVLAMAFTAADVSREWGLSGAALGVMLSAGLFGMAAGSLFVGPWADRLGRRPVTLGCLVLITLGMAGSALARVPAHLTAMRVVTGIGIGGILASLNVITSEYSSRRWRSAAIGLQVTGYPIGATVGGMIAASLIASHGWRAAFLFGAAASAVMVPVVVRTMPESLDFLIARRPPGALERLNALLARMGRAPVPALPEVAASERVPGSALARLFEGGMARSTVFISAAFFLLMFSFYFVASWTPKLLVAAGLSARQGITGGVLLNLGGIAGGSLFSYLSSRAPLKLLTSVYLLATAAAIALFGACANDLRAAFPIALGIGVFLFGSMVGLYATTPLLYPAAVRATGTGCAIGIGRIGAILAPVIAGLLVDRGWGVGPLYYAFAAPLVLAVVAVRALRA